MIEQGKLDAGGGPAAEDDPTAVAAAATAVDGAAAALLGIWDAAREGVTGQLSGSQLRALIVVHGNDGINLRGLARHLGMLLSSASRLVDRLVAAGVLEREPGRIDRREISLHLSPAGRALLTGMRTERRERLSRVLSEMSTAGRQALVRGLTEFDAVAQTDEAPTSLSA
ncbi:MarR family winged helix-turn-helix transcriptional regulator [Plantactinospora sp. KBS50]|uniref:MarR family winged helix-turn-helix transcriptional regulator n=1 Tax=Plantactinospora sp. KBS50 TaxID=2024580 RepID=UPI000BAACB5D|nr:MarR family transcriptional regulator [Plantactinospora sp. KBS50]ASW56393.1 MarR family transcriptional regulator [Plantactinospora sp. KBS50]